MIAGFTISGNAPKKVMLRGVGPSLGTHNIANPLADPVLELRGPDGSLITRNDNWKDQQAKQIEKSGIAPTDELEPAIVVKLAPGIYTAILSGKDGSTGIGAIELYDLDATSDSQLSNLSTRGALQAGDGVLVGGFIVGGETGDATVIVRAIGPSLAEHGVSNPLSDPKLELRDGNGTLVLANDNWGDDPAQAAQIIASGLAPTQGQESALSATLPPGGYTAILSGTNGGHGIGVVEVYNTAAP